MFAVMEHWETEQPTTRLPSGRDLSAIRSGGGTLFFPYGVYRTTGVTVSKPIRILGSGQDHSISSIQRRVLVCSVCWVHYLLTLAPARITVDSMSLDGFGIATTVVDMTGQDNWIQNCQIFVAQRAPLIADHEHQTRTAHG